MVPIDEYQAQNEKRSHISGCEASQKFCVTIGCVNAVMIFFPQKVKILHFQHISEK
jgi:hypothetical protein